MLCVIVVVAVVVVVMEAADGEPGEVGEPVGEGVVVVRGVDGGKETSDIGTSDRTERAGVGDAVRSTMLVLAVDSSGTIVDGVCGAARSM